MKKGLNKARKAVDRIINPGRYEARRKQMLSEGHRVFELAARSKGIEDKCRSQTHQDIFVLLETNFKRNGYFVDFGATDGVTLSNSYVLETEFGWGGILAEPARVWHDDLKTNRRAAIETDCVWKRTGDTLSFNEAEAAVLSTISDFSDTDRHSRQRAKSTTYNVTTISLMDLLRRYNAPRDIDYLSIDTEGSEFEILSAFDFDRYNISIITCEHNYTPMRQKIYDLLTANGYRRSFSELSQYDDWYVRTG